MKKILALVAIPVIAIALLNSCGKTSTSFSNSFKATVGSTSFSAAITTVTDSPNYYGLLGASSGGFPTMALVVPKSVGTFSIGVPYIGTYASSSSALPIVSISGTINVTAVSPNVTGTFSFAGTDTTRNITNVTNGTFSVKP